MAIKRWLTAMVCAAAMLFLSVSPVYAAMNTVPDLPELTGRPVEEQITLPVEPEQEPAVPQPAVQETNDNKMVIIGIASWAAFFLVAGVVAVVIIRVKKNPPGGVTPNSSGKLGRPTPDTAAYKERMLSDQHYRRY